MPSKFPRQARSLSILLALLTPSACDSWNSAPDPSALSEPSASSPSPEVPSGSKRSPNASALPHARSLSQALKRLRNAPSLSFAPSTPVRATAYRQWLRHLGGALGDRRLPTAMPPNGFEGSLVANGSLWLLSEPLVDNRGAGALTLRVESNLPLIVEAPHTFFDSKTLPLAVTLFETTSAQALLINTLHRGGVGSEPERLARIRTGSSPSDVAHNPTSFFHQAHLELLQIWPQAYVVQVHGFRNEKVPSAQIIVSAAGTRTKIAPVARALNDALGPGTAKMYPAEVKQLGGTKNAQAAASRRANGQFLHLELSASLRNRLARQASLRERFSRALAKGLSVP